MLREYIDKMCYNKSCIYEFIYPICGYQTMHLIFHIFCFYGEQYPDICQTLISIY